jgi:hypothetical protein
MRPLFLFAVPLLAACASTPQYDRRFGDAVRAARVAMIANPQASASTDPVAGMDGKAVKEIIKRYQDSFKEPPPVVNVISIGGLNGSTK